MLMKGHIIKHDIHSCLLKCKNLMLPLRKNLKCPPKNNKLFGVLDSPLENEIVGSVIGIEGWCLSQKEDDLEIEVYVDDHLITKSKRNDTRLDVGNAYPDIKNSHKGGFYIETNLENFEDGIHFLKIFANSSHNTKIIDNKKFILKKNELLPPKRLRESIGARGPYGNFKLLGQKHLNFFIELCHLKKDEHVLDVGCGVGRMAAALTEFLSREGKYEGFDIVPEAIEWNKKIITPQFPNFHFSLANIYNKHYNKISKISAESYTFPYPNATFDFVFLTSVFTHIHPNEFENYLSEISRVLKKNGRCYSTFFLLNDESRNLMNSKNCRINFNFNFNGFSSSNEETPEHGIALPEEFVLESFKKNNLDVVKPIIYGFWCGRKSTINGQDIVIAFKNK